MATVLRPGLRRTIIRTSSQPFLYILSHCGTYHSPLAEAMEGVTGCWGWTDNWREQELR